MTPTRYITVSGVTAATDSNTNPTPIAVPMEDPERYRLYRLCPCDNCSATGKVYDLAKGKTGRCKVCRGEGRSLDLVATCGTPEAVGVALVTLALEDEFSECPVGLMDRPEGQTGKWLILPWLPSARNISDAGRTLRSARTT